MTPTAQRRYERNLKRKLTADEVLSIITMTHGYRKRDGWGWQERYAETLEEYMANKPERGFFGIPLSKRAWYHWYRHPFGSHELNRRHNVVRRLVQAGMLGT